MCASPYHVGYLEHRARVGASGMHRSSRCLGSRPGRLQGILLLLALFAILPAAGCGRSDHPSLGHVHGTVTLDGAPLPHALVAFHPPKGRVASDITDSNGHYDLVYFRQEHGALVGKNCVRITTQVGDDPHKELVPAHYNTKTGLEKEVVAGDNQIDFDLQSNIQQ